MGLSAKLEDDEDESVDAGIDILSGGDEIASIQIMQPLDYGTSSARYAAGVWTDGTKTARIHGPTRATAAAACDDAIALARTHGWMREQA